MMDLAGRIRSLFVAFITVAILWNGASAQDVALPTRPRANEVIEAGITYNIEWTILNRTARMIVLLADGSPAPLRRRLEDISGNVNVADGSLKWPIDGGRTWNSSAPYMICMTPREGNITIACSGGFSIRKKATSPSATADSLGGLGVPATAGIVAAAVLTGFVVIIFAVLYLCRRRGPLSVTPSDGGSGGQHDGAAGGTPASGHSATSSLSKAELQGTEGYCSSAGAEAGALALKPELMEKERPQELGRADNNRNLPSEHEIYEMGDGELAEIADPVTPEDAPAAEPASINSAAAPVTSRENRRGRQGHASKSGGISQEEMERQTRIREIEEVSRRLKKELEKLSPGGSG
ncbi:hypothetical protein MAPG_09155 [Magnaporthiopsis poae ATCC 64411]|uniref:Uncharacterized protein n=1 Tax=Magnaporthiopsis poae (strain ATCC 64411 / 73-15) TaxID=644358 RepID=A0A0C4E976_MAGP6|nr:hypothetical protein MAPG_09155 [Magnaporthiopsis poae ATCC 64411]